MSLGYFLLAVWLVLVGLAWAAIAVISTKFLGIWALVTGIVFLLEGLKLFTYTFPTRER